MNRQPEAFAAIAQAAWPSARVGEALIALARRAGLPTHSAETGSLPSGASSEDLTRWIETSAAQAGLQAEQAYATLDDVGGLVAQSAPSLVRVAAVSHEPFLAVLGGNHRTIRVLSPDLRVVRLSTGDVTAALRRPFEEGVEAESGNVVARMRLSERASSRARRAVLSDRLRGARFRGCWLVRLPPGSAVGQEARETGVLRRSAVLAGAYVAQYALFILSWWLLGRGVLSDTIDRGWLLGWLLLLLSLIPLRLLATWNQGLAAVSLGGWLRRRLLRGAFMADRQQLKSGGAGRLFGLVVEGAAIDALALSGGLFSAFAFIELGFASVVLWAGAGAIGTPLLAAWIALVGLLAWTYFRRRKIWTRDRLTMTHGLLEAMVGHRTRLAQQPEEKRHEHEDEALDGYLARSESMDRAGLWLAALAPRGWLVVALAALLPAMIQSPSPSRIAISVGGILLAYRALQRLVAGLSNLTGAVIAAQSIAPLARAAARREPLPLPSTLRAGQSDPAPGDFVAQARDLTFRYRAQDEPVLQGCSLNIARGARFLLEGPSGSGKTTFASILAGLQAADSGVLLAGGLDRGALGAAGWRRRVVMAPQAHDNYLVGGSLAFNLLMGRRWPAERADLEEAEAICRELGLGELLDRLPGGLDQVVGETGWQLSQGERVRVFLARALLQHPELLVLDESFSALDSENVDRAMRCVARRSPAVLAIAHP